MGDKIKAILKGAGLPAADAPGAMTLWLVDDAAAGDQGVEAQAVAPLDEHEGWQLARCSEERTWKGQLGSDYVAYVRSRGVQAGS